MKKSSFAKIMGVGLLATGMVAAIACASAYGNDPVVAGADEGYTFTLSADNAPEAGTKEQVLLSNTKQGKVKFVYEGLGEKPEAGHALLNRGGSLSNSDPITGIKGITISYEGSLALSFGSEAGALVPVKLPVNEVPTEVIGSPSYFNLEAFEETTISSLVITYSCDPNPVYVDLDVSIKLPGYLKADEEVRLTQGDSSVVLKANADDILTYEGKMTKVDPYGAFVLSIKDVESTPFHMDYLSGSKATKTLGDEIAYDGFEKGFEVVNAGAEFAYGQPSSDSVKISNNDHLKNFVVKPANELGNAYTVKADIKGTIDALPIDHDVAVGIVAYYQDAENWIAYYAEWKANGAGRPSDLTSIQPAVSVNGAVTYPSPIWMDGCHVAPADGLSLSVSVQITNSGVTATANVTAGSTVKVGSTSMTGSFGPSAYAGVYSNGDVATFSNIVFEKEEIKTDWQVLAPGGNPTTFEESGDSIVVENSNWKAGFVGKPVEVGNSYTLSGHIKGTTTGNATKELMFGYLAYYAGPNDFVIVYAQYADSDRPHEIRCIQITGTIGGADLGWHDIWADGSAVHPADGFDLEVKVTMAGDSATFEATLRAGAYSKIGSRTVSGISTAPTHLGLYCQGEPTTYTGFKIA